MAEIIPELVGTVQSLSWQRNPDINHDLNPSTAASGKVPVELEHSANLADSHYDEIDGNDLEDGIEVSEDDIPYDVLKPVPRKTNLPPLPDMRFEQSYLRSLEGADTRLKVAWITIRDQIMLPLMQGTVYSLALIGWRHWNATASLSGQGYGTRARRWWYGVNNWSLDGQRPVSKSTAKLAKDVSDVSFSVWDPLDG